MCHEGGCGSCIVTVRARRQTSNVVETFSVNSVSNRLFKWVLITKLEIFWTQFISNFGVNLNKYLNIFWEIGKRCGVILGASISSALPYILLNSALNKNKNRKSKHREIIKKLILQKSNLYWTWAIHKPERWRKIPFESSSKLPTILDQMVDSLKESHAQQCSK